MNGTPLFNSFFVDHNFPAYSVAWNIPTNEDVICRIPPCEYALMVYASKASIIILPKPNIYRRTGEPFNLWLSKTSLQHLLLLFWRGPLLLMPCGM
jgi:hypothetical protein